MISMTVYWEQFKECVDSLPVLAADTEYEIQLATAYRLIEIGISIEKLGLLEIQQVSEQLSENAKLFQHSVSYTNDNHEYTFYLPKIANTQSFIFAILYYQHLLNYQNVSYQGSISWFRQKVIDGINQKKIVTTIQAQALLQEIRQYCKLHNLNIDEALFLKTEQESIKEYTMRITQTFNVKKEPQREEKKNLTSTDELISLEKSLERANQKLNQLKSRIVFIEQKLLILKEAKRDYLVLSNEWKSKWVLTRTFYLFLSLFVEVPEIKKLNAARLHLIQTNNEVNEELKDTPPKVYSAKLKKQLRKVEIEEAQIKHELIITKDKQQQKQNTPLTREPFHQQSQGMKASLTTIKINNPVSSHASSNNDYYSFFKPSKYTLQAIAVAAAAVAIQNLL